jgi:hypothetical protein
MKHFVAYHSTDAMGHELEHGTDFRFYSSKPRAFLEQAIGERVWVIAGTRDDAGSMIYRLAEVYIPSEISVADTGGFAFSVVGREGRAIQPAIILNDFDWFQSLRRSLANFSLGFSEVRQPEVISGLAELVPGD